VVEPDKEAIRVVSGTLTAVSYVNLSTGLGNVSVGVPIRLLSLNKVDPELANVSSGAYPLRRPIVLVTKTPPSPVAKAFVDFMLDKEGQKTILEEEFVPILVTK
jgi:phosphate transport system substrate-binding protein